MYSLYADRRMGMHTVAVELAARAIKSPTGNNLWNTATLAKILADPTYVGRHPLGVAAPAIVEQSVYERAQTLRKANKQLHPPRKDPWPMQGRLKCATCGSTLQCEYSGGHRYYRCSGRTTRSKYFLQTGKRCDLKGLKAEIVEEQLLAALCNAMLKPDNFARALERTIAKLSSRVDDLERETGPLEQALNDANEELERVEKAWIRGRLSDDELAELERDAEARRERIQSQLDALGAGDLEDLERTRRLIAAARASLAMAKEAGANWWSHPEAPPMWFPDVLTPPGWPSGDFVDGDTPENSVYDTLPPIDPDHTARTLNEALDRLEAEIWAKPASLEVRGLIKVTVPERNGVPVRQLRKPKEDADSSQALTSPSRGSPRTENQTPVNPE
jgi:AcrR family transcriptional regulator